MSGHHIRDERATREKHPQYVGEAEIPSALSVTLCGEPPGLDFVFLDANHALLSLKYGSSIAPCRGCLRELRKIIDNELGSSKIGRKARR